MPAKTEKQKKFFGAVMGAKKGSKKVSGAAKEAAKSMSKEKIKEFLTTKEEKQMDETSILANTEILSEQQKDSLKKIIDQIVEERVQERTNKFVKTYTSFIVEQATKRLTSNFLTKVSTRIQEEMEAVKEKSDRICRSVICEASGKIAEVKDKHAKIVSEFKESAPKLIESLAEKKALELSEDAVIAIKQNEKLAKTVEGITKGLESLGFVINEDVNGKIKKLQNENMELRTDVVKKERDLKLAQLSEGLLPSQKKEVSELLSECTTAKAIESKFTLIKDKVMKKEVIIEEVVVEKPTKTVINEEAAFEELIGMSKNFMGKR